jgi:hypothetical protein
MISRPVMRAVWKKVGKSRVDVRVSSSPKGSIRGIQPERDDDVNEVVWESRQMRPTSCVFHGPAAFVHLILLAGEAGKQVLISGLVNLLVQCTCREGPLLARENVEIVVRRVKTSVPLCAKRGAEEDEVLGDTSVNDVHSTHSTSSVVEDPVWFIVVRGRRRYFVDV